MASVSELNAWRLLRAWPLWLPALLLVLLHGLEAALEPDQPTASAHSRSLPDFGLSGFTVHRYGTDGQLRSEARGDELLHYPDSKESVAENVHAVALREGRPPWTMDARQARFDDAGTFIHLLDNVALRRDAAPGLPAIQIYTDALHYRPQEDYAETAAFITIHRGPDFIQSHGARAWLEEGRLQLLSRVRGHHPPQEKP